MSHLIRIVAHVTLVMAISLAMVAVLLGLVGHSDIIPERAIYVWLGIVLVSGLCYWISIMLVVRKPGIKPWPGEQQVKEALQDDAHYALQYPDGSYAWESNCQGWGSTPLKPKIGDQWCFTAFEAQCALRDLKHCKLIRITE